MNCKFLCILFLLLAPQFCMAQDKPRFKFNENYPDVHDPVMARSEDGRYYIFSTGMGVGVISSPDMKTWRMEKPVFDQAPQWAVDSVKGFKGHIWAPDISRHGDKWYLYYSCSTFGKNGSAIGLATNSTLDPNSPDYKWEDHGAVIVSHKHQDNWNAIDPALVPNASTLLTYGSFWDGIQLVNLSPTLNKTESQPRTIARRLERKLSLSEVDDPSLFTIEGGDTIEAGENAIEAPFVIYHDGWYYLMVSWDYCCRGRNSTYKTVYGRSRSATGPYLDKDGKDMAHGGGTYLVGPCDEFFGIGHCSAYEFDGQWYFVSHAYDVKENGRAKLFIRKFGFDKDGWIEMENSSTACNTQSTEMGPYTIDMVRNGIYHIQDFNKSNPAGETFDEHGVKTHFNNCSDMYLLTGDKSALLIDLSNNVKWDNTAVESLRKLVSERINGKPLTITFTHNHGDHTGMLPAYQDDKNVTFALPRIDFKQMENKFPKGQYSFYDEGKSFDLGDMKVNTLLVPGHTHGSMVFFLENENIIFTGDAIGSGHGVWIFNTEGFSEYAKALPRFAEYIENPAHGINPGKLTILGGHYWQKDWFVNSQSKELDWQYVKDMQTLINQIANGTAKSEPSNLGHNTLDTYFRLNNATIVWNKSQAEEWARKMKK